MDFKANIEASYIQRSCQRAVMHPQEYEKNGTKTDPCMPQVYRPENLLDEVKWPRGLQFEKHAQSGSAISSSPTPSKPWKETQSKRKKQSNECALSACSTNHFFLPFL